MDCPRCGAPVVTFDVPDRFLEHAPAKSGHAALCTECLTLSAAESSAPDPEFDRISSAFPTDESAVPLALAVGLLDSIALNRDAIEELLTAVEAEGTDPLLVLDRLRAQGSLDPEIDLDRRCHQVKQLFE